MLNKINIPSNRQKLIVCTILIALTLAIFWQVNQYDFINFDDELYVTKNSHIQSGITLDGFLWAFNTRYLDLWNPLVWLSFMFDYQFFGLNAGGYHVTNLILHILSTLMLFLLFNRITGDIWKSAFVAALFAIHPLHVESVAWIAERKDVLSAFFWMLTLCLYVYYTEKPITRRYMLVLLCFACALMSKPMVITLPIVMILLDYWPLDRLQSREIVTNRQEVIPVSTNKGKKKNKLKNETLKGNISSPREQKLSETKIAGIIPLWQLREKIPFFILSAVIVIITLYTPNTSNNLELKLIPLISRVANAPIAFVTYLEKTFWPYDMAILYPFTEQLPLWKVLGATLLIVVISAAVVVAVKRLPYLFVGWFWFAIIIAPVLGIVQVSLTAPYAMADRYHYLPSIGLGIMLSWGVTDLLRKWDYRKEILLASFALSILCLSIIAWAQVGYWRNSITLFNHTLKATDYNNRLAYNNRGIAFEDLGNYKQAIEDYDRAIEIDPRYALAYNNRGHIYNSLGNYKRAIEDLDKAIEIHPRFALSFNNRGLAYNGLGNYGRAIEDLSRAIEINPYYPEAYNNRGVAYNSLGNYRRAIEDLSRAIKINPRYAMAYNNLGTAYNSLGDYRRAIEDLNKAIEIQPIFAMAFNNRAIAYNGLGDYNQALEDLKTAARIGDERAKNFLKSRKIIW